MNLCHLPVVSGGDMDDLSPYEPVAPNRHPDAFRLASISSGITGLIFITTVFHMKGSVFWFVFFFYYHGYTNQTRSYYKSQLQSKCNAEEREWLSTYACPLQELQATVAWFSSTSDRNFQRMHFSVLSSFSFSSVIFAKSNLQTLKTAHFPFPWADASCFVL